MTGHPPYNDHSPTLNHFRPPNYSSSPTHPPPAQPSPHLPQPSALAQQSQSEYASNGYAQPHALPSLSSFGEQQPNFARHPPPERLHNSWAREGEYQGNHYQANYQQYSPTGPGHQERRYSYTSAEPLRSPPDPPRNQISHPQHSPTMAANMHDPQYHDPRMDNRESIKTPVMSSHPEPASPNQTKTTPSRSVMSLSNLLSDGQDAPIENTPRGMASLLNPVEAPPSLVERPRESHTESNGNAPLHTKAPSPVQSFKELPRRERSQSTHKSRSRSPMPHRAKETFPAKTNGVEVRNLLHAEQAPLAQAVPNVVKQPHITSPPPRSKAVTINPIVKPQPENSLAEQKAKYLAKSKKRQRDQSLLHDERRIKRAKFALDSLQRRLSITADQGQARAKEIFYPEAVAEVLQNAEDAEKERKKEMQRTRRREKAKIEAEARAKVQEAERTKREADEAKEREQNAERMRQLALIEDREGGLLKEEDSDAVMEAADQHRPRKSGRQRVSKLANIEPRNDSDYGTVKRPSSDKIYDDLVASIWRDIAKKEVGKVWRTYKASQEAKIGNFRKTATLASKEARRWQMRTNKTAKDIQSRAKRAMREMATFWKRNEKEERDLRRRAEKEALEKAKKEEEMRESRRQARKLNFLISQTELYSHFIGRKIKTDEVERSTDNATVAPAGLPTTEKKLVPAGANVKPADAAVSFEDLDFDDDDETKLQAAAAANAQKAIKEAQDKAREFNPGTGTELSNLNLDEGEMNFQNPTSLGDIEVKQPRMLNCQLKEYQLKGLNWLVNLYEQGINGILADEMGLGKTVQSISVMAYLAEVHNIWGPFLVIAPASTLHNWQQEIEKFVPGMKALPYWGNTKDRKVLRKCWDRKQPTYHQDSEFHVLITSYQLVVADQQYFQRMRWQYMILDEAQAIKSSQSARWKTLLGFHCRNRLLLTGTPIQNSMQELWALLHFIMPSLFDSHDEFSEWFSKDIESHAQSNTQLNEEQLQRLHMILKPFMLRRIKKHVQSELGDKIELDVYCDLTHRQKTMYKGLRDKISFMDLVEKASIGDNDSTASLMNLVMQFRKVCNHPDLFERADTTSPYSFGKYSQTPAPMFAREGSELHVAYTNRSQIQLSLPKLVYEGRAKRPAENANGGFRHKYLDHMMNIWSPDYINNSLKDDKNSPFSWIKMAGTSPAKVAAAFQDSFPQRVESAAGASDHLARLKAVYDEPLEKEIVPCHSRLLICKQDARRPLSEMGGSALTNLLNISNVVPTQERLNRLEPAYHKSVNAPPIRVNVADSNAPMEQQQLMFDQGVRSMLYGPSPLLESHIIENKLDPTHFTARRTLPRPDLDNLSYSSIQVPSMRRFVTDCGKLAKLDALLTDLKANGHRVLVYFQMTKMLDLIEEYLAYRNYKYLRLDGSSKLEDRRDMVAAWQSTPDLFIFLLSTRAGGLGINLTAADTVIFYDSDWNPTIDAQAMDRAHRLGQTKQVTVYRLITRGTIEERIRKRALMKEEVQRVVISGGDSTQPKRQVDFKGSREVAMWLFDEDEEKRALETIDSRTAEQASNPKRSKKRKLAGGEADGVNVEDMYHEGEGHFDESNKPSQAGTPAATTDGPPPRKKPGRKPKDPNAPRTHKRKSAQERLAIADGGSGNPLFDTAMGGM